MSPKRQNINLSFISSYNDQSSKKILPDLKSPPLKYFYWPFQGGTSFVDHLCFFVSCVSRLFIAALWSPAGKGLTSWLFLLYFCYFPMWYPGLGVVLDCIVSQSLPSFLLVTSKTVIFFLCLAWLASIQQHPGSSLCIAMPFEKSLKPEQERHDLDPSQFTLKEIF